MLVKEILEKNKGKYIKLGGKLGFIFCSKVDENTEKVVDEASKAELKRYKKMLKNAKWRDENFTERWKKRTERELRDYGIAKAKGNYTPYRDVVHLLKHLEELKEKELARNENDLTTLPDKIKNFKPIMERQIIDAYPSQVGDGDIFIFEGETNGAYWDREEYETGVLGVNKRVRHDAVQRAALRGLKY